MYNAQTTKENIKSICKTKKINMEQMLKECNLGVNAIRQINDNKGMASFSLARIADYLNCSVDYLLGRTDNINSSTNSYNNNGDNSVQNIGSQTYSTDGITKEMVERFENLDFSKKIKVMTLIDELGSEKEKK